MTDFTNILYANFDNTKYNANNTIQKATDALDEQIKDTFILVLQKLDVISYDKLAINEITKYIKSLPEKNT